MKKYSRLLIVSTIIGATTLAAGLLFWLLCLNHVSVTNIGVAYNSLTGEIRAQPHPGWYVTSPFVRVTHISTLPVRVAIPSNARIINQKLIRFRQEGVQEFIKLQGFEYLAPHEMENILLGYAYSGQTYVFLEIIEEPSAGNR